VTGGPASSSSAVQPPSAGFSPPPYPYDRLRALGELAAESPGGLVDLSVGTPCDPPPADVVAALGTSGTERGYPSSVGAPAFREAAARYLERRFGVQVDPSRVAACIGTKEFVASAAWYLRLRQPQRDTVLGPALAYPTYSMGATFAGCRYVGVPPAPDGSLDVGALTGDELQRALLLWVNSPANPHGASSDLAALAEWGRRHDVPVCSDECYAEFTWERQRSTILQAGVDGAGVLALHSLSKRSNLAGVRVGFYSGDADLVSYLSAVRTHAGLMVPGPVQAAAVVALGDDGHVEAQRRRYLARLEAARRAFAAVGLDAPMPDGGFYLWVAVPEWARLAGDGGMGGGGSGVSGGGRGSARNGAWVLAEVLARAAGILVSPGEFYGEPGAGFVRVALVVPDQRLGPALDRLVAVGPELPAMAAEAAATAGGAGAAAAEGGVGAAATSVPRGAGPAR
jgi:aspartate/methionine/tyrosine aminotransferase